MNINNNELVKKTINSGKLYPRPKEKCDICNDEVVLCWGDEIQKPYWRHTTKIENIDHKPNGESINHRYSKQMLMEYLNSGKKCSFKHLCNNKLIIPKLDLTFKNEVSYKNIRFDIGGFDKNDKLVFGIEIMYTHKTSNINPRNDIDWVEIKADDVIELLDVSKMPSQLLFSDISKHQCCANAINLYPLEKIAKKLGYLAIYSPYSFYHGKELEIYNYGYFKLRKEWNCDGILCECDDDECYTCVKKKKPQNIIMKKKIWNQFIYRKQCLYCEKKWTTSWYKPYCFTCYKKVSDEKADKVIKVKDIMAKKDVTQKFILNYKKYMESVDIIDNNIVNKCGGDGECILISIDENKNIAFFKNKNISCHYSCQLCVNYDEECYGITLTGKYCMDCYWRT